MNALYYFSDCGNYYAAVIYFCCFYLIITYIMLGLLVAIIVENFSLFYTTEEDSILSYSEIKTFQMTWKEVCGKRSDKRSLEINLANIVMLQLRGKLVATSGKSEFVYKQLLKEIERTAVNKIITFHQMLMIIAYRSVPIQKFLQLEDLFSRERFEAQISEEVARKLISEWLTRAIVTKLRNKDVNGKEKNSRKKSLVGGILPGLGVQSEENGGSSQNLDRAGEQGFNEIDENVESKTDESKAVKLSSIPPKPNIQIIISQEDDFKMDKKIEENDECEDCCHDDVEIEIEEMEKSVFERQVEEQLKTNTDSEMKTGRKDAADEASTISFPDQQCFLANNAQYSKIQSQAIQDPSLTLFQNSAHVLTSSECPPTTLNDSEHRPFSTSRTKSVSSQHTPDLQYAQHQAHQHAHQHPHQRPNITRDVSKIPIAQQTYSEHQEYLRLYSGTQGIKQRTTRLKYSVFKNLWPTTSIWSVSSFFE